MVKKLFPNNKIEFKALSMKYILLYKDLKKILIVNDLKVVKEEFYC